MLVLTRKLGERIRIGETVVTVVRIAGGRVKLGIQAPAEIAVVRAELLENPKQEPEALKCAIVTN